MIELDDEKPAYTVHLVIAAEFTLPEMPIGEAYAEAGQQIQKLMPTCPEVAWNIEDISIRRGGGSRVRTPSGPPIDIPMVKERMRELGIGSARELALRCANDPEGPTSHTTVSRVLRGLGVSMKTRRLVARALEKPEDWLY